MKKFQHIFLTLLATLSVGQLWAATAKCYYRGDDNSWGATLMTIGPDGLYAYIQSSNNANKFKIARTDSGWDYNYTYVSAGFNNTDVTKIGDYSSDNCYCWQSGTYYILVYYPNTTVNSTSKPIICAATYLPDNRQTRVYYVNSNDWATPIKAYAWNTTYDQNSTYGGQSMTSTGKTYNGKSIYTILLEKSYANIIFNSNSSSTNKTGDLTLGHDKDGKLYYNDGSDHWVSYRYDVALDQQGGTGGTESIIGVCGSAMPSGKTAPTRTGYNFGGYYTAVNGGGTQYYTATMTSAKNWPSNGSGPSILYAKWTAKSCTVTLDYQTSADGYNSSGAISNAGSLSATYDSPMTTLTGTMPTAKAYYGFDGFYTEPNGGGTKYYNADGTSATNWAEDTESATTLYAYYKKYSIEDNITLSHPVMEIQPTATGEADKDYVIADVTIDPTVKPADTHIVCWRLLYSDGVSPVLSHEAEAYTEGGTKPYQVRFPIVGLAAGTYKIEAVLRKGSSCGTGDILSTTMAAFRIADDYTVTIKYMCGDIVLKTQTTQSGNPLDWTDVTAPDIIGYKFKEWKAGEGITLSSDKTTKDNSYTAEYDATLTAIYEHKRTIYFNNTLGWSGVTVYFYSGAYWDGSKGTGSQTGGSYTGKYGAMTQIDGTNIWYYDCEENNVSSSNTVVAFTEYTQNGYTNFSYKSGTTTPNNVVYRTDYDYNHLPMYVPLDETGTKMNSNQAVYYNHGYWINYPENTGYWIKVYDRIAEDGAIEVASIPFEFTDEFTLSAPVDLALSETTTYGFKIYRADNQWFGNNGIMKNGNSGDVGQTPWEFKTSTSKCGLLTTAAGTYTFTLSFANKNGYNYVVGVHYPTKTGDFQVVYKDLATWSKGPHTAAWSHPSRVIYYEEGATDTVSFFISKGSSPTIQFRKVTGINSTTGEVSWGTPTSPININDDPAVEESGVYNIIVSQSGGTMSLVKIEKYTGPYYIRSGALNSKWGNYRNDYDHKMTYSAFSESEQNSFGEKFSHYKAKWCPRGTNVMFCIANDYSPCISDTLIQDYNNEYENIYADDPAHPDGELMAEHRGADGKPDTDPTSDMYSANIRFMWNWHTNKISRAYVASATNVAKRFLVLVGDAGLKDKDGNAIPATANLEANAVLLHDDQNWIYESYIKAVPGTYAKLYACYTTTHPADAQYFRGDPNVAFDEEHAIKILGGTGDAQKMRIIYDFKTNRLVTAWMPSSDVSGDMHIQADAMIIRDHQGDADCITLANEESKLSEVRTVYGVMKFNRWTLNNRRRGPGDTEDEIKEHCLTDEQIATYHPLLIGGEQIPVFERQHYFISFPFDVNLSDVFGFGTYGEQWIISRYNGLRRAQQGYFADNCFNHDCTNWDYIHSELGIDHNTFVLKANEGYLLSLDLSQMEYNDTTTFWLNQIHNVELFFPSNMHIETIATSEATLPALGEEYQCLINHNSDGLHPEMDHTIKDSYWRCIGVPGYNDYTMEVLTGEGGENIAWQPHPQWEIITGSLPFLYEWNTTDNSLTPRSTHPFHFRPTFAYLVQCSSAIYWQKVVGKPNTSSIVARRQTKTIDYTWRLTLEREGTFEDQTYIRMSTMEQVTDSFDFGQDLSKEPKYNHAYLYSFVGNEQVAANSMSLHTEETTLIPLGVVLSKADQAGDYTFALPDGSDGIGITLIDSLSGMRTNLSTGLTYTATLSQGTHNGRFWLEISPVQETPTALDPVTDDNSRDNVRKRMIDGRLYIIRDGRIYDARGTRVQ